MDLAIEVGGREVGVICILYIQGKAISKAAGTTRLWLVNLSASRDMDGWLAGDQSEIIHFYMSFTWI